MAAKVPNRLVTFSKRISGVVDGLFQGSTGVFVVGDVPWDLVTIPDPFDGPAPTRSGLIVSRVYVPDFIFVHNRVTVRCVFGG